MKEHAVFMRSNHGPDGRMTQGEETGLARCPSLLIATVGIRITRGAGLGGPRGAGQILLLPVTGEVLRGVTTIVGGAMIWLRGGQSEAGIASVAGNKREGVGGRSYRLYLIAARRL
jgi:hypothetical protein